MPEEARRRDGDDAVVIPIGTGGRPGRGSGSARPSSAARNLAPSARKAASSKPATKPAAGRKKTADRRRPTTRPAAPAAATRRPRADSSGEKVVPPPADAEPTTADRRREQPAPSTGIPVGDWLAAAQDAAQEVFGADWERRLAELMAFVRRRLEGDYEVDDYGFDRELTERFFMAALRPIAEKWFRLEVRGLENIPAEGGALVVSNHSGTVPLDGLMTMLTVHDHAGRFLRPLGADLVFKLPLVSSLARKGGATLACTEDAERMLSGGELVGVWPEGFKGIGKPFSERYKLQRFGRGGFVSAALRTGVPIIPLSVVGRRGDLPARRQRPVAGAAARGALHPDHAVLPVARSARHGAAALEVDPRVRRADPHRRLRARRGRGPDAGLQRHRPGARDHPAHAVRPAARARQRLRLTADVVGRSG